MNIRKFSKKKAISPILATVILIAITLIAAVAIAGFVFGLFSSFTSSASVSASIVVCHTTSPAYCKVMLTNTGTANTAVTGCSIQIAGSGVPGIANDTTITAGVGQIEQSCTLTVAGSVAGSQVVGSFSTSNGATVPFSGVWNN